MENVTATILKNREKTTSFVSPLSPTFKPLSHIQVTLDCIRIPGYEMPGLVKMLVCGVVAATMLAAPAVTAQPGDDGAWQRAL